MIYNINFGIGWASSGVEYAQMYRARMLRAGFDYNLPILGFDETAHNRQFEAVDNMFAKSDVDAFQAAFEK